MGNDIFGQAIKDFYDKKYSKDIVVHAPDFDDDSIPVPYLFRSYPEMPAIEQKALDLSKGKVLDVGCGAGSHAIYLQKETGLDVSGIDISKGAIDVCKKRGLSKAEVNDFFNLEHQTFDTILFLMNGSGIIGRLDQINRFFAHLKMLLHPGGQILLDSSDISYLFTEEDGSFWVDTRARYYGEMKYQLSYKKEASSWFDWLYIDYNTLQNAANTNGFLCELILEGDHHDYLARLTLASHIP